MLWRASSLPALSKGGCLRLARILAVDHDHVDTPSVTHGVILTGGVEGQRRGNRGQNQTAGIGYYKEQPHKAPLATDGQFLGPGGCSCRRCSLNNASFICCGENHVQEIFVHAPFPAPPFLLDLPPAKVRMPRPALFALASPQRLEAAVGQAMADVAAAEEAGSESVGSFGEPKQERVKAWADLAASKVVISGTNAKEVLHVVSMSRIQKCSYFSSVLFGAAVRLLVAGECVPYPDVF